jgi:hypothetical protein
MKCLVLPLIVFFLLLPTGKADVTTDCANSLSNTGRLVKLKEDRKQLLEHLGTHPRPYEKLLIILKVYSLEDQDLTDVVDHNQTESSLLKSQTIYLNKIIDAIKGLGIVDTRSPDFMLKPFPGVNAQKRPAQDATNFIYAYLTLGQLDTIIQASKDPTNPLSQINGLISRGWVVPKKNGGFAYSKSKTKK